MAHIPHLTEDKSLKLEEIRDVLTDLASGSIPEVTEKMDGINIRFTISSKYEVRLARSKSDMLQGGYSAPVFLARFHGRGPVEEAFVNGVNALRHALRVLSPKDLRHAYGDAELWRSGEIVYTGNPNVVRYSTNAFVFHAQPVQRVVDGDLRDVEGSVIALGRVIPDMNEAVKELGWRISPPKRLKLAPMAPGALDAVATELSHMGPPEMTLQEYLIGRAKLVLGAHGMRPGSTMDAAAARLAEAPDAASLTTLKGRLPYASIDAIRGSKEWIEQQLRPLELAITNFANARLNGMSTDLVDDNGMEAGRIRRAVTDAIATLQATRNPATVALLRKEMEELVSVDRITTPVEGLVFRRNMKTYKVTGAFAPASQILGLIKYGRGTSLPPLLPRVG